MLIINDTDTPSTVGFRDLARSQITMQETMEADSTTQRETLGDVKRQLATLQEDSKTQREALETQLATLETQLTTLTKSMNSLLMKLELQKKQTPSSIAEW